MKQSFLISSAVLEVQDIVHLEQIFVLGLILTKKPVARKGLKLHFRCSNCDPLVVAVLLHVLTRAMGPMHVH